MKNFKNDLKILLCCLSILLQISVTWARGQARIVGGLATTIDEAPYLVQILKLGSGHCAGSLITEKYVVTAAHCVYNITPTDFEVLAGHSMRNKHKQRSLVKSVIIAEGFSLSTYNEDVAVIELETPFKDIEPITVCTDEWKAGDKVKLFGWGLMEEDIYNYPSQLQTVEVEVVDKGKCAKQYQSVMDLTDSMACASAPGKDSCKGDSGGPAIINGKLCGIVSYGIGCGRSDYPGLYTVNL